MTIHHTFNTIYPFEQQNILSIVYLPDLCLSLVVRPYHRRSLLQLYGVRRSVWSPDVRAIRSSSQRPLVLKAFVVAKPFWPQVRPRLGIPPLVGR